ncbi:hypothetical protein [Bradyrhizobium archetypum]|uniref:Uncharacterized protein n=1 Tax=Bradyrhizobium archetypum TaxID=2721160 RepID=A0A7Y4M2X0_9BRAD|nr:hypothetical protein [Bradyrhizobium archetypum]NOJ48257.1 hypothetical protein [Bradyrhizobium archetypum]
MKFVPALFAGVVAGTSLATVTDLRAQATGQAAEQVVEAGVQVAQAADACLSAPKGATPSGSHWYYRIDRATKRQCWYLREESERADDKFTRAAPPASAPVSAAAEAPAPPPQTPPSKQFADARAEWVSQQSRAEQNAAGKVDARTGGAVAAPAAQNGQRAAMPNVLAPSPLATMRWNDPPAASASTNPAAVQMAATATPADQPPQAEEVQQPAAEQVAPAAAEPAKPKASLQMLLLVMAAALALAGLTVSAIVRIGRMRARRAMRRKRRAMWDSTRTKRSPSPVLHDEDIRPRRAGAAPNLRAAPQLRATPQDRTRVPRERARAAPPSYAPQDRRPAPQDRRAAPQDRERQVTEMLSRLARSAQT